MDGMWNSHWWSRSQAFQKSAIILKSFAADNLGALLETVITRWKNGGRWNSIDWRESASQLRFFEILILRVRYTVYELVLLYEAALSFLVLGKFWSSCFEPVHSVVMTLVDGLLLQPVSVSVHEFLEKLKLQKKTMSFTLYKLLFPPNDSSTINHRSSMSQILILSF